MRKPNRYDIGDELTFAVTFTQGGVLADPTDVFIYVGNPTFEPVVQTFTYGDGEVVRDSVGKYHLDFVPLTSGWWEYKWQGIGAVIAAGRDTRFYVRPSFAISEPLNFGNNLVDSAGDLIVDTVGDQVVWG
jgi:hypothetical protein